jgi:hypothetical protein
MVDARRGLPVDPIPDIFRCVQLMVAIEIMLRKLRPPQDTIQQQHRETTRNTLRMWNVIVEGEMTVESSQQLISETMEAEPDPFSQSPAWSG